VLVARGPASRAGDRRGLTAVGRLRGAGWHWSSGNDRAAAASGAWASIKGGRRGGALAPGGDGTRRRPMVRGGDARAAAVDLENRV
jgi:hypothetical protein